MIDLERALSDVEMEHWAILVRKGIGNAVSGLSQMVGQEIRATSSTSKRIPVKDAPALLGGAETTAVMVYIGITGSATGHMALIYPPEIAFELVDMLLGIDPGTTRSLEEMEESALGEMGNIIGSFFLNTLADETGLDLRPSPPAVMMDMVGAIMDVALAELLADANDLTLVETTFGTPDQQINGTFLVMPSPVLMKTLVRHWHGS